MNDTDLVWHTEQRKISELVPFTGNPRELTEKQAKDLETSLRRFNLVEIPAVNLNKKILAGHQRLKIMQILGRGGEVIDVRMPNRELTEEEEREYLLRSNKNTGQWNDDELANWDEDLLLKVGWTKKELAKMFDLDAGAEEDEVPEPPVEARAKKGQIFTLGTHRVMCGDSTCAEDVVRLMAGKKSKMIFTDPPYNVDYGSSKNPRHKIRSIENDSMSTDEWSIFCHKLFEMFQAHNEGDIYMWGASAPEGMRMRLWLTEMNCHWSATIIWKKQQLVLTPANYQRMYEPCFYGWFDKSSYNGDRKQTEVWEIDRPHDSKLHPTMKPLELCQRGIQNSSLRGDLVLDLFLGSGSTLIACEQTSRSCYGMEIDERYVDVIIERFCKLTGADKEKIYAEAEGII